MIDHLLTFGRAAETLTSDAYIGKALDLNKTSDLSPSGEPLYCVIEVTKAATAGAGSFSLRTGTALSSGDLTGGSVRAVATSEPLVTADLAKGKRHILPVPYPEPKGSINRRYVQPHWDATTNAAGLQVNAYLTTKPEYWTAHADAVN